MIILTPTSTAFIWLDYDRASRQLTVGFRDRTSYEHNGVPEQIFELLLSAPSQGRYYNQEIRNRYRSVKVEYRDLTSDQVTHASLS